MAIVVLDDVILSNRVISAGVRGRQIRQNRRVQQVGGQVAVNVMWQQTLREFEIGIVPMRREAWQDIESIHEVTDGGAYGFLMEDPKDSSVTADGVVVELTSTTFQLYKRYTEASRTKDRKITRPRSSGFVLSISGVAQSSGYTLNTATGVVTIVAGPLASTVTWTGRFYVPVHFMSDSIDWAMVVAGQDPDARFLAGPSVVLQEVRE